MIKECKHKFKPRYNKEWSNTLVEILKTPGLKKCSGGDDKIYLKKETYIYDICVKCGKIIKDDSK